MWKGLRDHLVHPFPNCVLQKSRSLGNTHSRSDRSNKDIYGYTKLNKFIDMQLHTLWLLKK